MDSTWKARVALTCVVAGVAIVACDRAPAPGHSHGPGGTHGDEPPAAVITRWTDRTELFMEYPVLVARETGRAAIHITDLADFSPVASGEAVVRLRSADGKTFEFREGPSRPGIFGVDLGGLQAGEYQMTLDVVAPGLEDRYELGPVTVHPAGTHSLPPATAQGETIAFLKEQQWKLEFGTAAVAVRTLRSSVTVPATVQPRSGGDAVLTSPVSGRIESRPAAPVPGTHVRSGEVLVRIAPRSDDIHDDAARLRADVIETEQDHALAVRERDRVARLVGEGVLPARERDEAEAEVATSKARLDAARDRWSRFESLSESSGGSAAGSVFTVRAPFDGIVSEVRFAPGATVEENDALMRVIDPDRVHVVGYVPESLATTLRAIEAGELLVDGEATPLGQPLAINPVVDPQSRTVDVRFALDSRQLRLSVGQAVQLRLFAAVSASRPAVPESALVDDGGGLVVFVQIGGESFERRLVTLGNRAEGYVHVLDGVAPGERVVDRGAYLIRLAAMSTQIPAHGHVH